MTGDIVQHYATSFKKIVSAKNPWQAVKSTSNQSNKSEAFLNTEIELEVTIPDHQPLGSFQANQKP